MAKKKVQEEEAPSEPMKTVGDFLRARRKAAAPVAPPTEEAPADPEA